MTVPKMGKVAREGIAVQEQDMVGIDGLNSGNGNVVPIQQTRVLIVGRLIEGIIASNPWISFIV